jgi:hypothetical protein
MGNGGRMENQCLQSMEMRIRYVRGVFVAGANAPPGRKKPRNRD